LEAYLRSVGTPRDDTLSLKVAGLVRGLLSNSNCFSEQAALALGIHERTLQRRLHTEDTSFEQIKDDVRREIAESLLAQPSVSLSHITYVLGYADSSAFARSARRWFGMAARTYRARLLAAAQPAPATAPIFRTKAWEAAMLTRDEERSPAAERRRRLSGKI
jgi:AraC-like DNA-binding protein